jgi:hypothetical protein
MWRLLHLLGVLEFAAIGIAQPSSIGANGRMMHDFPQRLLDRLKERE